MEAKALASEIVKKLVKAGYIAYFAGGWVRDYLLGHPSSDIDIATDAPPEKILDLFPNTILVGLSFGVVIVVLEGHQFEVATFRKDVGYGGGRKPLQIELATPQEDALRRDFTINGMFYDPLEGVIYDFVHGTEDLRMGVIRTIGNPHERFVEDRLRMIRAVRFACRFGFLIDQYTQDAIQENADTLFPAVAMERIWMEFRKMADYPRFDHALIEMHRLGLLPVVFPRLQKAHLNEIKQRVAAFAYFPKDAPAILYLRELFDHLSLEEQVYISKGLKVSTKDLELVELADECKKLVVRDEQGACNLVEWVHFYAKQPSQLILEVLAASMENIKREPFLKTHKLRRESLKEHIGRAAAKKMLVTAAHLQQNGIPPGKSMGALLKEAEALTIIHDSHNPAVVVDMLKRSPLWPKNE